LRVVSREFGLYRAEARKYGLGNWVRMRTRRVRSFFAGHECLGYLSSPWADHPLAFRPDSSDLDVYRQIFIEREYQCFDDLTDVRLIIDCGANVGYSAAYFLSRFQDCSLVAIEPDPANLSVLERNLAPYKHRARVVHAGVWSHRGFLRASPDVYGDGREWSRQVIECQAHETGAIPAVDIGTLLRESDFDRISILKVDIEGAEAVVFGPGSAAWLPSVDNIAIELHERTVFGDAPTIFAEAVAAMPFALSRSGELTVCRRLNDPE
jgi:FkbM family methyltransferase